MTLARQAARSNRKPQPQAYDQTHEGGAPEYLWKMPLKKG